MKNVNYNSLGMVLIKIKWKYFPGYPMPDKIPRNNLYIEFVPPKYYFQKYIIYLGFFRKNILDFLDPFKF